MRQAARMCRKRGRIVLVGVTGLELSRADFYEKELSFQVSCSYGPGRHDPNYEEKGQDYPVGFVRWTEQRNFEAVLDMLADGRLDVKPLISHRFALDEAAKAYAVVSGSEPSLGILLQYETGERKADADLRGRTVRLNAVAATPSPQRAVLGFIGSGNYATGVLIPAFAGAGARLKTVASYGGVSGLHAGRKFGFEETTTDVDFVLGDPDVTAVVISTRHDSHADLVCKALGAGKHVFLEKPLGLSIGELDRIEQAVRDAATKGAPRLLMVGFNRRFAPHIEKMHGLLQSVQGPKSFVMTVNAGFIPKDHWTQDKHIGGGRIVGEGCHFIDLLRYLTGASVVRQTVSSMTSRSEDTVSIGLEFGDGSIGTVHYFANGTKAFPKERLEVFAGGRILQLDNFRRLRGFGWPGFRKMQLWHQDKGQKACAASFVRAVQSGGEAPVPFAEIMEVSRLSIEAAEGSGENSVHRHHRGCAAEFHEDRADHPGVRCQSQVGTQIGFRLVHTGQHYDARMSGDFFEQLGIPQPDVNLEVGSGTQAEQTGAIMTRYERLLLEHPATWCLVVGDVTSTMACAITAQKLHVPVAHVEAGIRSGDWTMPEEINRMATDAVTNWFFTTSEAPTQTCAAWVCPTTVYSSSETP